MNAAMALRSAPAPEVGEVMRHLVADPNLRIRLIAAGAILAVAPEDPIPSAVLMEALAAAASGIRRAALELVESLGTGGAIFLEILKERAGLEEEPELREMLAVLIDQIETSSSSGSPG
jgi:hypothetical protein